MTDIAHDLDRPLISGLTERLTEAGVDPHNVVDDAALRIDIDRMWAEAVTLVPVRRWWRHRR